MTRPMTLEELRLKRANDTRAMLARQRAPVNADIVRVQPALGTQQSACSARELEWLQPVVALQQQPPARLPEAPHLAQGVSSPFAPSMLVVIYTARYFLLETEVYTVYGALQVVELPVGRGLEI